MDVGIFKILQNLKIFVFLKNKKKFDPLTADSNRRWKSANVRIGLESRVLPKFLHFQSNMIYINKIKSSPMTPKDKKELLDHNMILL